MSGERIRRIAGLVQHWVEQEGVQAMVVLAARRGVIVLHQAFGRMTPAPDAPPTRPDAVFRLASITKVLTATSLMTLVDEGRVGLNRPVASYIPEFQGEGKETVLVRHLLTHTSGLREENLDKYAEEHPRTVGELPGPSTAHPLFREYLALRYDCPLWKRPGTEMSYCDYNLDLAADIVRRVSGYPLDEFARDRIFRPLGMEDSHYCLVDVPPARRVVRPSVSGTPSGGPLYIASQTERLWFGAGYASSSAHDLAVFAQMFLNGGAYGERRILSPASAAAMTRNQTPGIPAVFFGQEFKESSWGLGWGVEGGAMGWNGALQSPTTFGHLGNGGVHLWADPEQELIGVCLATAPPFATPAEFSTSNWARHYRNDLFADAISAAVEAP